MTENTRRFSTKGNAAAHAANVDEPTTDNELMEVIAEVNSQDLNGQRHSNHDVDCKPHLEQCITGQRTTRQ